MHLFLIKHVLLNILIYSTLYAYYLDLLDAKCNLVGHANDSELWQVICHEYLIILGSIVVCQKVTYLSIRMVSCHFRANY
jgi:hypothetical protein